MSYEADLEDVIKRHVKNAVIAFVAKMNIDNNAEFSEKDIVLISWLCQKKLVLIF